MQSRYILLALFLGVALIPFAPFLTRDATLFPVALQESLIDGRIPEDPYTPFPSDLRHARVGDPLVLLRPHLHRYNQGLKRGELRLWNPSLACGLPAFADTMLHPFYPPRLLLHALLPPDPAYEFELLLHLAASGLAMAALLAAFGRSPLAQAAGGLVWMLFGYHAVWFSTGILLGLSVFGPLAARALLLGLRERRLARAAEAALCFSLVLLGSHPQFALLFFLVLLGAVVLAPDVDRAFKPRFAGAFAVLALGGGLAALLPRLDVISSGYRAPDFDRMTLYAQPFQLLAHLAGLLLGKVWFPAPAWEFEFTCTTGLAAFALAAAGARSWRPVALLAVAALAVAFLRPLADLHAWIPLLNLSPSARWISVAGFALALLVARGWDEVAERGPGRLPVALLAVTLAFLAACLVGLGPLRLGNGAAQETLIGFGLATLAAFVWKRSPRAAAAAALAAILFELLSPFVLYNAHSDPAPLTPKDVFPDGRVFGVFHSSARSLRDEQGQADLVSGNNLLAAMGMDSIGGFESILPDRTTAFAQAAGADVGPAGRSLTWTRFDSPLLDAMGLRWVFLSARFADGARSRPSALPIARLSGKARIVAGPHEAATALRSVDLRAETILEEEPQPPPRGASGSVEETRRGTDRLAYRVRADSDTLLVVADAWDAGWEATLDGRPVPLLPANLAFRAVAVPAGDHVVEMVYRPVSVRHGIAGSILFLIVAGVLARRRA
jgi:hypothetical protein